MSETVVVAFGGNALSLPEDRGRFDAQIERAERALAPIAAWIARGDRVLFVHGNGPQVGHELLRGAAVRELEAPPLDACVASTQGSMGYALERALRAALGAGARVAALVTMVRVDLDDPAMARPDKPVGPFYSASEAERLRALHGWAVAEDAGRGHRRVVPSPRPREVIGVSAIRALLDAGYAVIAGGGGGVPIASRGGADVGVEAVVDKDHTAALLGASLGAATLVDLTSVDAVYRDFGTERASRLARATLAEVRALAAEGHFPPGSMGPKIEAACAFLEAGGARVIITSLERLEPALRGEAGTWITEESA